MILSGGDPLSLSDARLTKITDALAAMPHVQRIRVHTRQPIVLPSRVDEGLLAWLRGIRRPTVIVLHANHPNEIDDDVRAACAKLRAAGVTLLNQSVLLKGVNDDADTLAELSRGLMDAGVMPYYLHLPDRVRGTAHFDVAEAEGAAAGGRARARRLSGYLVPRLVREVPGCGLQGAELRAHLTLVAPVATRFHLGDRVSKEFPEPLRLMNSNECSIGWMKL